MQGKNLKATVFGFIILIIAVLSTLRPVVERIFSEAGHFAVDFVAQMEKETQLTFHYGTISPSIFSGLKITNVSITDENQKNVPVEIEKITVNYSVVDVLRQNFDKALQSVEIAGVSVDYADPAFRDAIMRLAHFFTKGKVVEKEKKKIDIEQTLKKIIHAPVVDKTENGFTVSGFVLLDDTLFKADVDIDQDGAVSIDDEEIIYEDLPVQKTMLR